MSDFERQLREAMSAAVADAQPPSAMMELVRRRHRRHMRRVAAASAVALAVVVAVVPVVSALRGGGGQPAHRRASAAPLFPGGGRILLDRRGVLEWLYPDGRTVQVASGFAGATLDGGKLLAWKNVNPPGASRFLPHNCFDPECTRFYGQSYYTMNLDGSDSRLVLPAERPVGNIAIHHMGAQLSPNGSALAYIRQQDLRNGKTVASELWSVDLATGRKIDLGPYPAYTPFVWRGSATILAESADVRALQLLNVSNGNRTTYLTVNDPRLIRAYEHARPGEGPPAFILPDGWSTGANPSALAVSLDARRARSKSAEVLVEKGRVLAFAPKSLDILSLTRGPGGIFLLYSGAPGNPGGWDNATYATYVGTVQSEQLSRQQTDGDPWNTAAFNPEGNVIALWYAGGGPLAFVPISSPACDRAGRCLHFQPKPLFGRGTLLAWAP